MHMSISLSTPLKILSVLGPLARAYPTSLRRVYTLYRVLANPYNARARNVRACPRARARGMNQSLCLGFSSRPAGPSLVEYR